MPTQPVHPAPLPLVGQIAVVVENPAGQVTRVELTDGRAYNIEPALRRGTDSTLAMLAPLTIAPAPVVIAPVEVVVADVPPPVKLDGPNVVHDIATLAGPVTVDAGLI